MRRNTRRPFNEEYETKKIVYISVSVLIMAIIAFGVTFFIYSNKLNKEMEIGSTKTTIITDLGANNNQDLSQASSQIGKTVNEMQSETTSNVINEEITKVAINTSNMEKTNTVKTNEITTNHTETKTEAPKKEEKIIDPTFSKPVDGEILREFAKEKLVYSTTLKEWITHNGVDIKADKATIVKSSADGTVRSIKNDPRYGITVVVEHVNGFTTVYSNLLTAEFVKENEKVKKGQTLGTVGNTASFEIADESHLHFEILKNGEYLDPNIYIK